MHPLEKKANDAAKLRHAMGNVFASRTYMRKLKLGGEQRKSQVLTTTTTNNDQH
jgi:hypothetical protein